MRLCERLSRGRMTVLLTMKSDTRTEREILCTNDIDAQKFVHIRTSEVLLVATEHSRVL